MESAPRKVIAAINMTLDGYCDHTAMIADEETHDHYTALVRDAGALLYGRVTYQLMEAFWPGVVQNPTGNRSLDEFASAIDHARKIVFSRSLETVTWRHSELRHAIDPAEIARLKRSADGDLLVGSPGLINAFTRLGLVDEYQLCIHPVVMGHGRPLFQDIPEKLSWRLLRSKTFGCGSVVHYYKVNNEQGTMNNEQGTMNREQ